MEPGSIVNYRQRQWIVAYTFQTLGGVTAYLTPLDWTGPPETVPMEQLVDGGGWMNRNEREARRWW